MAEVKKESPPEAANAAEELDDVDAEMFHNFELKVDWGNGRKIRTYRNAVANGPVTEKWLLDHLKKHRMFTGAKRVEAKGIPGGNQEDIQRMMERKAGLASARSDKLPTYAGVTPRKAEDKEKK